MTRFESLRALTTALVIAAGLLFGGIALAQAADPASPPEGDTAQFSKSNLQAFAAAQDQVMTISRRYQEKARSITDSDELGSLQQEMTQKQIAAVQSTGLDLATYNAIASAAQSDPALAARISEMSGNR